MRLIRFVPLVAGAVLAAAVLGGCANLPTLPNDAAAAAGGTNAAANAAHGQATTGQFQ